MFNRVTVLTLAALAAAAAGCGGGDDTPSSEALTKSEFTTQVNHICASTDQAIIEKLSRYMSEQPNDGAGQTRTELFAGAVQTILLPETERQLDQIESLSPPTGDEKEIDSYLKSVRSGIAKIRSQEAASFIALKNSLFEFEDAFTASAELAGAYGISRCQ